MIRKKKYLSMFIVLMFLASLAMVNVPVQSSPSPVTFAVDMPPQGYISGVDPLFDGGLGPGVFTVDILVNASELTTNTAGGMVGYQLDVKVDPAVLEPLGGGGAGVGYFLYDFMKTYYPFGYSTSVMTGSANTTTGYMDEVAEQIIPTPPTGAGGTGTLVTLYFKSLSETAYSPIQIGLFQEGVWEANWMDATQAWHDADCIDGHYNQPPTYEHDVAVTSISAPSAATVGDIVPISVDVANLGSNSETFDVTVTYDATVIDTQSVWLDAADSTTLSYSWNTTGVALTVYTLTAEAILATDEDLTNNEKARVIQIKAPALVHDVAVTAVSAPSEATVGDVVPINVGLANLGTDSETFEVKLSYDQTLIATDIVWLPVGGSATLPYSWNTAGVAPAMYTLKAEVEIELHNDTNMANNEMSTPILIKVPGALEHDVAVTAVSAPSEAAVGDVVPISVDVTNLGSNSETFDVTVTYDATVIDTQSVTLALGGSTTLSYSWDTAGVAPATYTLTAEAILATDEDLTNNNASTTIAIKFYSKVALVGHKAWAARNRFSRARHGSPGYQTLYGKVKNLGTTSALVRVAFELSGPYIPVPDTYYTGGFELAAGDIFTLDTDLWQFTGADDGPWTVKAVVEYFDPTTETWEPGENTKTFTFTVKP